MSFVKVLHDFFYLSRITKCSGWRRRLKSSAQSLSMYCDIKRNCRRHESGRSWGKCYIKNALGSNTKKYKYFNISNEYENAILLYLICRHCLKVQSAQLQCAQNTQITNCGTFRLVQKRTPSRPFNTYGKRLKRLRWVDTSRNYQYFSHIVLFRLFTKPTTTTTCIPNYCICFIDRPTINTQIQYFIGQIHCCTYQTKANEQTGIWASPSGFRRGHHAHRQRVWPAHPFDHTLLFNKFLSFVASCC